MKFTNPLPTMVERGEKIYKSSSSRIIDLAFSSAVSTSSNTII